MSPAEYAAAPLDQRIVFLNRTVEGRGQHKLIVSLAGQRDVSLDTALAILNVTPKSHFDA